jgi:hypothetical protein
VILQHRGIELLGLRLNDMLRKLHHRGRKFHLRNPAEILLLDEDGNILIYSANNLPLADPDRSDPDTAAAAAAITATATAAAPSGAASAPAAAMSAASAATAAVSAAAVSVGRKLDAGRMCSSVLLIEDIEGC